MYRRLIILTTIILVALCALGSLGYDAVHKWAQGLEGTRLGQFAEVAEQIRQDVKRKLDDFVRAEQQRPYTDYLYSYVPGTILNNNAATAQQQEPPLLRSPLGEQISNGFAYGYFQIEPDNRILMPYFAAGRIPASRQDQMAQEVRRQYSNVESNVLPSVSTGSGRLQIGQNFANSVDASSMQVKAQNAKAPSKNFPIESLSQEGQQSQVITQQRDIAMSNSNQMQVTAPLSQQAAQSPQLQEAGQRAGAQTLASQPQVPDTVQIRIEPFVPVIVGGGRPTVFAGQVFLLRRLQIENRTVLQGFQLDEKQLVSEVRESARRFMREGMAFDLPQVDAAEANPTNPAAYAAVLSFGFGDLTLDLSEIDPQWIAKRVGDLQHVYLAIVAVVAAAVAAALASLWHNVRAQVRLARKKDDFISSVSHELRTPLTSIRMYAEMLERNWVKSADKLTEYYRSLRQESERLSRLVDNVLDFSRIQKGRKKYSFELGDINHCVAAVAEMMKPYAGQYGFSIRTDLVPLHETSFDRDAVTQIVVNLIDNAVKYARSAEDKTITVRTHADGSYTIIEVEDHGPGIPHRQRKKVFEQFYRCSENQSASEPTQNPSAVAGTGLGLTLVKRFAEAHHGFVEILSAHPTGVILKVHLAAE
jgi:signal transduction histidine kinase